MDKERCRLKHPRNGGGIEYAIRKLPQGQGDSLRSLIYRRIVEDCGDIQNFIKWFCTSPIIIHQESTISETRNPNTERSKFSIETSICEATQLRMTTLRSTLPG